MKGNRGFIKLILLIVVVLVILGFYGFNLKNIINSPTVHDNFVYVWNLVATAWNWLIVHLKALVGK